MSIRKLATAAFLGVAALGLSGCVAGLPTQVSRYQAMPSPQGQSFFVVPANGGAPGLEFSRYAAFVAQAMQAQGYSAAPSPGAATMLVKLNYGVDQGSTEYRVDPFYRNRGFYSPFYGSYYGSWGRPMYYSRYSRYGRGYSPFYYGWDDPFYSPFDSGIDTYEVYKSFLDMNIVRRVDNAPLFEGHAKARSSNDNLGVLVPNLVEAMFTGFPGRSGETVRITVPPRKG